MKVFWQRSIFFFGLMFGPILASANEMPDWEFNSTVKPQSLEHAIHKVKDSEKWENILNVKDSKGVKFAFKCKSAPATVIAGASKCRELSCQRTDSKGDPALRFGTRACCDSKNIPASSPNLMLFANDEEIATVMMTCYWPKISK